MNRPLVVRQPVRGAVCGQERLSARAFGNAGGSLKLLFSTRDDSEQSSRRRNCGRDRAPVDEQRLREQLGRLGGTPFALGAVDTRGLVTACFFR